MRCLAVAASGTAGLGSEQGSFVRVGSGYCRARASRADDPDHHPWEPLTECVGLEDCKLRCLSSGTPCAGLAWSPRPEESNNCSLRHEPRCNLYFGDPEVTTTSTRWQEYTCYAPVGRGASWAVEAPSEDHTLLGLIDRIPSYYWLLFDMFVLVAVLLYCCEPRLRRCCRRADGADECSGREADGKADAEHGVALLTRGHTGENLELPADIETAGPAEGCEPVGEDVRHATEDVAVSVQVEVDDSAAERELATEERFQLAENMREDVTVSVDVEADGAAIGRESSREGHHAAEHVVVSVTVEAEGGCQPEGAIMRQDTS